MASGPGTPLTVTVVAPPDSPSAWIRLVGDVDMEADPALAEAADRLGCLTAHLMVIDLAAVTFAGATLTHFIDTVHHAHPDAALVLRQPSPLIRRILTLTGQDQFVVITSDPESSATSPAADLEHLQAYQPMASHAPAPPAPNTPEGPGARRSGSIGGALHGGLKAFDVVRARLRRRGADANS